MVYHFLTGSYAAPEDVGVCRFSFDPAQGFSLQKGWENFINPSFLLKHPHHPVLYTVEETTPEGTVRAWELQGALLRPLGQHNPDPFYAQLEDELLERINALGIGPQGFGGLTTALAVHVEAMPTHIACMPVAVNINCHVARHAEATL